MAKRKVNTQPFWRFLFLLYMGLMIWLLFFRGRARAPGLDYWQAVQDNFNIIPFYTIDNYVNVIVNYPNSSLFVHCFINLVGNVVMFIPAGWLLPRLFAPMRKFFRFLLTCFVSILLVEVFQLFTLLGSFDVDDIILNLAGMIIGFIVYLCKRKK